MNGASLLLSGVAIVVALPLVAQDRPSPTLERRVLSQLRAGIAAVLGMPWLWVTIGVAALSTVTLAGPLEAALPFLVSRSLGASVDVLGLLGSLSAGGAIAAAVMVGRRHRLRHRGPLLYAAWLVAALMVLLMGLPIGVVGVACAMAIAGAALATLGLVWAHSLQELVPRELRGRVASITNSGPRHYYRPVSRSPESPPTSWDPRGSSSWAGSPASSSSAPGCYIRRSGASTSCRSHRPC